MSDSIRADYEQLEDIALRFMSQSSAISLMMDKINEMAIELELSWEGQAATAFFAELNGMVLPATDRLMSGLGEASSMTVKIIEVLKAAEEEAAAPFRGEGALGGVATQRVNGGGETAVNGNQPAPSDTKTTPSLGERLLDGGRKFVQKAFQFRNLIKGVQGFKSVSDIVSVFGKPLNGIGAVGPVLGVVNGFFDIGQELGVRVKQNGEDFAEALSLEAGEGTAEILSRLALYSNPFTGIPTFVHDVGNALGIFETDFIEGFGEVVGRGANASSDALSDGLVAVFNNPEVDVQVDFPRTTIRDFERAGKPIPNEVAQRLFFGLLQNEGRDSANQFINEFATNNNLEILRGFGQLPIGFIDK